MKEILLVNPSKRRKRRVKKSRTRRKTPKRRVSRGNVISSIMMSPIRRRRRKTASKRKIIARKTTTTRTASTAKGEEKMAKRGRKRVHRRRRHNPTSRRALVRRASSAIGRGFMGLNFKGALAGVIPTQIGMFAAKWASKRFGEGKASEGDPESWSWAEYLKGGVGGVAGALIMNMIRPHWGQKTLEGALNLVVYKAIQNELIAPSEWAAGQFGAGEEDYSPTEYMTGGADEAPWMYGEDGSVLPADDRYRLPEEVMGALEPVGPLGALEPVGPLGADEAWSRAFTYNR